MSSYTESVCGARKSFKDDPEIEMDLICLLPDQHTCHAHAAVFDAVDFPVARVWVDFPGDAS